jgi:dehydrogenase/reductase SDR family protein 7B
MLKNKTIWITGASSGIGEAMAIAAAQQGANLILSARRESELQRVAELCASNSVFVLPLDIADTDAMPAAVQAALQKWGRIDILVNNAGISQRALALETELEVDKQLIAVNYIGTVALSKTLLPAMLAQGGGTIAVVSSLTGKFGTPYRSSYAASKHALHGFFDSLRAELYGKNIGITLLCPGFVRTNISLNALTANGTAQQTMDEATDKGLSPEIFAKRAWKAILQGKEEVYIGQKEVWGVYLKRWLPTLFSKIVRKAKVK